MGRQKEIRKRTAEIRAELDHPGPMSLPDMLLKRLANLSGGVATLKVGGVTKAEREIRRGLAEDTVRSVRAALEEGVVPGGGAAYVACIPALESAAKATEDRDVAAGVGIVAEALAAPLEQIAINSGYSGSTIVGLVRSKGSGSGFDALTGEITADSGQTRILDPTKVLRTALQMAGSTAAMFLTTEAVVLSDRRWEKGTTLNP